MAPDSRLRVRAVRGAHAGRRGYVESTRWGSGYWMVQLDGQEYYKLIKMDDLEPVNEEGTRPVRRGVVD